MNTDQNTNRQAQFEAFLNAFFAAFHPDEKIEIVSVEILPNADDARVTVRATSALSEDPARRPLEMWLTIPNRYEIFADAAERTLVRLGALSREIKMNVRADKLLISED